MPTEIKPIEALVILIAEKCDRGRPDPIDISAWLIDQKIGLIRMAVEQLIAEAMEWRADNEGAKAVLEIRPALREIDDELRQVAECLGVQRRYLYTLTSKEMRRACRLAKSMFELRENEAAARNEALEQFQADRRPTILSPAAGRLQ